MTISFFNPDNHHAPLGNYSHAAMVGPGWLGFIAGQVAVDKHGDVIAPGNIANQAHTVFQNLSNVLDGIGADFEHVVQLTTYIVDEDSRLAWQSVRDEVFQEYMGMGPYPPNTVLYVQGLARPELMIEVQAIVRLPDVGAD